MNTGKSIKTTDDIDIRCRINSSEEHTWHTTNSQLNLVVYLLFNLLISWGKRQDILDQKFANLFQEYKKLVERDRKSTRLNSSHITRSRMPSSA